MEMKVSLIFGMVAGVFVLFFAFLATKHWFGGFGLVVLGLFEVVVFLVEKDFSVLFAAPFIAIIAGVLVLLKR